MVMKNIFKLTIKTFYYVIASDISKLSIFSTQVFQWHFVLLVKIFVS